VHLIGCEARLDREGTSGPTLAGKAMTHGDPNRIARRFQTKLLTTTGRGSRSHRRESYETSVARRYRRPGVTPRRVWCRDDLYAHLLIH
jgi:hypothetical protein